MRLRLFGRAILCAVCLASPAGAGTVTDTFDVTLTIQAGCEVSAPNNLNFGTETFLDTALFGTVDFSVRCTSGTNGTISLNGGIGSSGSVATRTMESGANSVNYSLYMNNSYATIWGDGTSGTSTYPHTGTGSTTNLTIYGRVPSQTTPTAGTYSDTITITVTY
jgi:spore coat protein U domain-containing protein, fimbrial subunit CupE1/2/3/6